MPDASFNAANGEHPVVVTDRGIRIAACQLSILFGNPKAKSTLENRAQDRGFDLAGTDDPAKLLVFNERDALLLVESALRSLVGLAPRSEQLTLPRKYQKHNWYYS